MTADLLISNVSVFDGEHLRTGHWFSRQQGVIRFGEGDPPVSAAHTQGGHGRVISPLLVDTHVHGGGGYSAERGEVDMAHVLEFHRQWGTGPSFLSLMTDTIDNICQQLGAARSVSDSHFLGIHLEGPFLAEGHRGCHPPDKLRSPSDEDITRLIAAGEGVLRSITVAPELIGASQVSMLVEAGIVVCLGHTDANYEQTQAMFDRGARVLTHAFNGMPGIHHRAPGPVMAAIDGEHFTELIADGHHVQASVARLLPAERVILVTDAMSATGQPDGSYALGDTEVQVVDGIPRDTFGSLAGSTLTMGHAVRNYATWTGSVELALRAAITNPRHAYGIEADPFEHGALIWSGDLSEWELI